MDLLLELDKEVFTALNHWYHPMVDTIMLVFTNKYTWIPAYLLIIGYILRYKRNDWYHIILLLLLIIISDQLSSGLIKPLIGRLRPCHDQSLADMVRLLTPCGGQYSFISGHATNSFALATYLSIWLRGHWKWLLLWAIIVSYSRIYVGVHYPLDVIAGGLLGAFLGWLIHTVVDKSYQRIFKPL